MLMQAFQMNLFNELLIKECQSAPECAQNTMENYSNIIFDEKSLIYEYWVSKWKNKYLNYLIIRLDKKSIYSN